MMRSDPWRAVRASGRSSPWVSEMTPMTMTRLGTIASAVASRVARGYRDAGRLDARSWASQSSAMRWLAAVALVLAVGCGGSSTLASTDAGAGGDGDTMVLTGCAALTECCNTFHDPSASSSDNAKSKAACLA